MKFQTLHINHFGHFADLDLSFGDSGIAVLYGRNEAGKTTLLEFLRQLLFGIDERTPYSFGDGGEVGGTTRFVLSDNRVVELRRRKGRKNTVQVRVDGKDTDFGEAGFHQLLGHADKEVFQSVFAFGLNELQRGNEALRHESLQSALFGGGLGGAFNPEKLLQDFDNQAGELFKSAASKPTINALSKLLGDLAKEIKQKAIRSDDYERSKEAWEQAQSTADQLSRDVTDLRVRHSRMEKLVQALPRWLQRRVLRIERDGLVVPAGFPNTALSEFTTTLDTITRVTGDRDQLQRDIVDAKQKLAAIQLDKTLLPLKDDIIECHGLIKSVEEARRDLPRIRAERGTVERDVVTTLRELRPGWTLDDLSSFSMDAATRHMIEELVQRRTELNESRTTLNTRRDGACAEIARIADDLAELGEPRDLSALAAIVDESVEYTADQKALKKESDARAKLAVTLETQRTRLSPPLLVEAKDAQRLPVPPKELAERFDRESRDVASKLDTASQSLADEEQKLEQLEQQLAQLEQQQRDVPKLEELTGSRTRRDDGWRLIRSRHIDGDDRAAEIARWLGDGSQSLPDVYEQVVAQADQLADAIYEHADAVTSRKQFQQQIEQTRQTVARKRAACERVRDEQKHLERLWTAHWQPCGFEPLPPDAMRRWLDEHSALVATHETLGQKAVDLDSLRQRIDEFEATFRTAMNTAGIDVAHSLAAAKQQVKSAEAEAEQRKKLERDRKRQQKTLDGIDAELCEWQSRDTAWRTEWQAVLEQLELPTEWDTELARNVISGISAAQAQLAKLSDLSDRIRLMEQRIDDFDPRVRSLCERLAEPVDAVRPEVNAKSLHERLTGAAQAQERRDHLEQTLTEANRKLNAKQIELESQQTRHGELLALAEAGTDAEFLDVAERARRATQLDADFARLTREIELLRGNEDAAEFETLLREGDLAVLQGQLDDLQAELTRKQTEANSAHAAAGSMRHVFAELDGRNDAARLQEDLARKQAQLASEIHRYVPLVFAKNLLQQAIKRFERENQPEMIGSISKLFATMTGGRYVAIERPSSDHNAIYVRRVDGAELTPDQLSTGTREQLYLAIRLGYVLHYCRQTEPLPIVMDDVLVNFDDDRSRATLEAFRDVSRDVQVLFFTCHQHFVDLIGDVFPDIQTIELPTRASGK